MPCNLFVWHHKHMDGTIWNSARDPIQHKGGSAYQHCSEYLVWLLTMPGLLMAL